MTGIRQFHPRNKHQGEYHFDQLIKINPNLQKFVIIGKSNRKTIDFSNQEAVKELNRAILLLDYGLNEWNIPEGYLCPPVPGRADYVHTIADLLADNLGKATKNKNITCLDVGAGANCIYPVIGISEYNWRFIASETDQIAIQNIEWIITQNRRLENKIQIRKQSNPDNILKDIIQLNDLIDCTMCNPPFFASEEEAIKANIRKSRNLSGNRDTKTNFNFGGIGKELWYKGGELAYITKMIRESKQFASNVFWFTSLVSSEKSMPKIIQALRGVQVTDYKVVEQNRGNKKSRIVAWTFLSKKYKHIWIENKK